MTGQPFRNPTGGRVDRSKPLRFTFDGADYTGFAGDTLASALLANGVKLVGRSFKYHRRRGIFSAGVEEPNALVQLRTGDRTEPDLRATEVELFDGLIAESQNRWPSLNFDIGAINDLVAPLIPAGFYYKTFMAPARLWHSYEHWIRKATGLGRAPDETDPDRYEHRYAHCDVLIAGGGPSGLMAALAAGRAGARVIIADSAVDWGGSLLNRRVEIDGNPAAAWVAGVVAELEALPEVTLLSRSTVSAYYDHNMLLIAERVADHLPAPAAHQVRQRLWQVRANEVVLATGAIERPLTFDDNDRPGVMLASAAQAYANRFGVRAGDKAVVFTNNDHAYEAAVDLKASGVEIMAVIDARADIETDHRDLLKAAGIGLALMAGHRDEAIPADGTTTFRPPFTPVTLGTIAGEETGEHFAPTRRSAMHDWHAARGAPFVPAGLWLRPQGYPGAGETIFDAMYREAKTVRQRVGMVDVSTLGKIDIKGRDAAEFLNRVYINGFAKLPVGKVRYGVMLREDGLVFDDGTTTHIADNHFMMTTTKAVEVMRHLEYHAQVVWPDLDVHLISVTEEWAAMALAGPHSRRVLKKLTTDIDVSNEACPFMAFREGTIAGAPGRLFRISFSGELAYEINVPADYGLDVWERVLVAGEEFGIAPYGTEAMNILRMEKGHIVGGELNGRASPEDLGFSGMLSKTKDFIGRRGLDRPAFQAGGRKQLVGLVPVDHKTRVPRGAQLVLDPAAPPPVDMQGEVTSNAYSPNLGHPIALGLLRDGRERHGETLHAHSPVTGETVAVFVTEPCFIDLKGERLRA